MANLSQALDPKSLSAEAQRALTGPAKMMAARGLAPLSDGRDLLSVLFQLSVDADPKIRSAATETARALPETVTLGALNRADVDAKVLHFFAALVARDSPAAEQILLNQATADETVANIARRSSERESNLIAANEQRLLRCPAIIGSLYQNKFALQSTVDRAVELAIRNQVRVPGIAQWEELAHELMTSGQSEQAPEEDLDPVERSKLDQLVSRYLRLGADETIANPQAVNDLKVVTQMRIAVVGPIMLRNVLLRSRKAAVAMAVISGPKVTEADAAKYAGNLSLSEDVIRYIARRREWTKNYQVKVALVKNPKCPLPSAMKFLPFLRERELSALARSKNVTSALRAQARKLMMQRKPGDGRRR